jgi:glutathione synthase/RimK-type ligase-like ATP-grasp enzyme
MNVLVVVSDTTDWPLDIPGVQVVSARDYLTDPRYAEEPRVKVINMCRSYRYQSNGYYVSLLAAARGHRPLPDIGTVQDLKSQSIIRVAAAELDELIQHSLAPIQSQTFELSVYFGRNVARRHDKLAGALYRMFQTPLMRASFAIHRRSGRWAMTNVNPLAASEIPEEHRAFVLEVAREHVAGRRGTPRRRTSARFDLAILRDPSDPEPASNALAIKRFVRAGEAVGFDVEIIDKDEYDRIAQFDALFIRDTTTVNHYTFRFARKAAAEGLVVIDDPSSILRCMNKVYLAELMQRNKIPIPRTLVVHKGNVDVIERELGLPCVLKQPDSAFSAGVVKVATSAELQVEASRLLEKSSLVVAQEFRPTPFDWRIGVLDGHPLYACRYYMARKHWQIYHRDPEQKTVRAGKWDTLPVEQAPTQVVRTAVKAATLYGDALYGVDLKEDERGVCVIEVNENPSIDAGVEDQVLKEELYLRVMRWFMGRVEQRKRAGAYA